MGKCSTCAIVYSTVKKMANKSGDGLPEISLLLHDIRSAHNVGSIFRTADAFGVTMMYLSGYTPAPKDRFGRKRADIAKVALGAEDSVVWKKADASDVIKNFNGKVIALEQSPKSIEYRAVHGKFSRVLLILGNEVGGISRDILDRADIIVEIPMRGKKESLNVSVAAGIALFGMFS